jgi:hypothetical protein
MGIIPALRLSLFERKDRDWLQNWSSHSWLLTPLVGDAAARIISVALFAVPFVGFLGAALALMGWVIPHDVWRPLALVSAAVSMAALALYWNALVMLFPHKVGDIAVNVAVLVGLLWANWPTEATLGY